VWFLGAYLMSPPEAKGREAAWPFALGTLDDVAKRFPRSSIDPTATRVAAIADRLDTPMHVAGASKRAVVQSKRLPLQSYIAAQIVRQDDAIESPPSEIRQFLDEHVAALDELRTLLASDAVPHWAVDADDVFHSSIPDLAGHMQLFRILAADALDRERRGDHVTAWQDAEAGWSLGQGLWSQPDIISTLIALAGTRMMNDVAAKLAAPAPPWHRQLLAFDAERAVAAAMQFEAWRVLTIANRYPAGEPDVEKGPPPLLRRLASVIFRPSRLRRASENALRLREDASELARSTSCGGDPALRNPVVNVTSLFSSPGIWRRLHRFRVEREAVEKLLMLKEQRRRSGVWPGSMPGIERSSCSDGSWRYRHESDGSMSLTFLGATAEERNGAAVLPPSFHYAK
jgi:hypothetical protein